jgi:hypothetical protein
MHLIHILLPLNDDKGKPLGRKLFLAGSFDLPARYTSAGVRYPSDWCNLAPL